MVGQGTIDFTTGTVAGGVYTDPAVGSSYENTNEFGASALVAVSNGLSNVGMSFGSTFGGTGGGGNHATPVPGENMTVRGLGPAQSLVLIQNTGIYSNRAAGQHLTITFDQEVSNLEFAIDGFTWPIVGTNNEYKDTVQLVPAPDTTVVGNKLVGTGATGDPIQPNAPATVAGEATGADRTATVTYAGPLTSITLHYYDSNDAALDPGQQGVGINYFSFDTTEDLCV